MTATKTTRRPAAAAKAAKALAAVPVTAPVTAPAKRSHRQLAADAVTAWQQANQQALTLVAHLSGTAAAGSIWKVRTEGGEEKRAKFTPDGGRLTLTGFEDTGKTGRTTRTEVAAEVARLGGYEPVMHSQGSVWTVKDAAGKLYSFDRKAGTITAKAEKKAPAKA